MTKQKILKNGLALLIAFALFIGLILNMSSGLSTAYAAAGNALTTALGTSNIPNPVIPTSENDAWKGSYVYFGTYNGTPVKYRVLDSNTTAYGGTTMLLDCNSVLWAGSSPSSAFDARSNDWINSDIREYLNGTFLSNSFSAIEQDAIANSTIASRALTADSVADWTRSTFVNYVALEKDKIFLLDAEDVSNGAYGYSMGIDGCKNRKKTGANDSYLLRSADSTYSTFIGCVYSNGRIYYNNVYNYITGISPALNIDLSSVLFSSIVSGLSGTPGATYKLTLLDSNITIATSGEVIRNGYKVTIPYTYNDETATDVDKVNKISVMITDKTYTESDAKIIHYVALQDTDLDRTTGTGTFTLPSGYDTKKLGTDYHMYIIAESAHASSVTDYAGSPVEITRMYDEVSSVAVEIDEPVAEKAFDTSVTVTSDIKDATVTWMNGENKVTGNAGYNTTYTVKITLTVKDGCLFADDTVINVNGNAVTAKNNDDGTITANYTFAATEMGTVGYAVTGYEGTYDGKGHSIKVDVNDTKDALVTYSTDKGTNKTYSATNPIFTDAGTYTVYYKIVRNAYTTVTGSEVVRINKRAASVKAMDQTIAEGDDINKSKYTVTGLLDEEKINAVTLTPSISKGIITVSIDKIINTTGKDVTGNYEITCVDARLVVEEKETPSESENSTEENTTSEEITSEEETETVTSNEGEKVTTTLVEEEEITTFKDKEDESTSLYETETSSDADVDEKDSSGGGNSHIYIWILLFVACVLAVVFFITKKKQNVE